MAISFGHKDNQWRSKYSFRPKAMMNSSRGLLSKGELTGVYKHNEGDVNSFYGVKNNSVLGVAFNDNPSSNKVFKSISLEGSDILKTKRHDFAASTSTESPSQNKYYLTSKGKNMGGIIYNTLGKSDVIVNGTSMHYVGDVTSVNDIILAEEVSDVAATVDVDTSYSSYSPVSNLSSAVKYGFYLPDEGQFYFGSDVVTGGDGDDGEEGSGGDSISEDFDNCDALQLYQESQFYEIVFYPSTGYLHLYIPNNVPVGDHTYINPTFLVNNVQVAGQYVDETTEYYDQFRWSWRVFIGEPSSVNVFLESYSGNFLDQSGNPLSGYDFESPTNVCTFGFGLVNILQGDIDPSVACDQLATNATYSTTLPSVSNDDATVTVTFSGDGLQDPEFASEASNIYLYNYLGNEIVQPFSISYTEDVGTEVTFTGLEPTSLGQVSWDLYFQNGDCDQNYVPWTNDVFVSGNEVAEECSLIYEELPQILSDLLENPSQQSSLLNFNSDVQNNSFSVVVSTTTAFQESVEGLSNSSSQDLTDTIWGSPILQNLTMTLARFNGTNLEEVIPMEADTPSANFLTWFCANELVTSGEWRVYVDLGPCPASLASQPGGLSINNYDQAAGGIWISTIEVVQSAGNCDFVFTDGATDPYYKYDTLDNVTFKEVSTSGGTTTTTGNVTFNLLIDTSFSPEDFVLFIGNRTTNQTASGQLPYTNNSVTAEYVQDGGGNFSNDNDITSVWSLNASALTITVSGIPMDPSFEIGEEDTYITYYDWAIISKTCINNTSVDNDQWRNQAPWNTDYGILGSTVTDSLTDSPIGGPIVIEASGLVDGEPEAGELVLDVEYFADLNNDGGVGSADLLDLLTIFGEEAGYFHTIVETSTGNSVDVTGDLNNDGFIGSADLLSFLTVFGENVTYQSNGYSVVENPPTAARASKRNELFRLADLASGNYGLSDIPSSITATGYDTFEYTATSPSTANLGVQSIDPSVIEYIKSEDFPSNAQLFAFISPEVGGDDLRGQTAELLLDLGQEDFELFAVNLNYEPLNADHTK